MGTFQWLRGYAYEQYFGSPPQIAVKFATVANGMTIKRTRYRVGVSGVTSADSSMTTVGRIMVGVGLCTRINESGVSYPLYPITQMSLGSPPAQRWMDWTLLPLHLTSRDSGVGVATWELAGGAYACDVEAQALVNMGAGNAIDAYVTLELSENWDSSGTLIAGVSASMLVETP